MIYKSGINLFSQTADFFLNEETVVLFSAYIKTEIVKHLNAKKNIKQVVVRWEIEDLIKKVSDIDLYIYCKENNIQLFRNTRIHLKAAWNFDSKLLFGSANYTNKGIGESSNFNYELNGLVDNISFQDKIYLNNILKSSILINDEYYKQLKKLVDETVVIKTIYPDFSVKITESNSFLLSELPMSLSPDDLYDIATKPDEYNNLELNCAAHDIALYEIDIVQEYSIFQSELNIKFNSHPFVMALKNHIKRQNSKSLNYGKAVQWIRENTTTVPTPRNWEIKEQQLVNTLYTWICYFDEDYDWYIPGNRSEVIFYKAK
ncbi:hypothetical protein [Flavobacterium sp. N502540]|uniref:hypothetical protein n=1 Tax=Flavobacterium sp. N502540 TaxID=2986838 RepID=UPI002225516A|nr:hypothetical protein [Flavobacterium sp. N502540]